ncbi:MAG: hypothetical protein QG650_372 [Patescibacteria group bacterium]|nr:hypothetical protein [Patescibacteria group bacterium]
MNTKTQNARRSAYFVWKDGTKGAEIPLPRYDVTQVKDENLRDLDRMARLRIPNHLPLIRDICAEGVKNKRIVIFAEGERKIAVALDQDIRAELIRYGAQPINPAYRHKINAG